MKSILGATLHYDNAAYVFVGVEAAAIAEAYASGVLVVTGAPAFFASLSNTLLIIISTLWFLLGLVEERFGLHLMNGTKRDVLFGIATFTSFYALITARFPSTLLQNWLRGHAPNMKFIVLRVLRAR